MDKNKTITRLSRVVVPLVWFCAGKAIYRFRQMALFITAFLFP